MVCSVLEDLGISDPTKFPSRKKIRNDFLRYGKELHQQQKENKTGLIHVGYDCKSCDHLQPSNKKEKINTVSVISQPNSGHDAYVGHQVCGHAGIDVGAAVWDIIKDFKGQKTLLAQGTGNFV